MMNMPIRHPTSQQLSDVIAAFLCLIVAVFLTPFNFVRAAPEDYIALPAQRETVDIEGQPVTLIYRPAIKLPQPTNGDSFRIPIYIEGDLDELQHALAGVLAKQQTYDECGDRIRVHSVSLEPNGEIARLTGTVKYERWECIKTKVPEFRGLKVTFKNRIIAKTRLLEQSAAICINLRPVIEDEGRLLRLDAQVTCAKPSDHSLLGKINSVVSLEGEFRRIAQDAVNKARDKLVVAVPEDVRAYDPRLTYVAFIDHGAGHLGLEVEGYATLTPAQLRQLIAKHVQR